MKVKIGNKIYDPEIEPIMIILSDQDKKNIADMLPECTKYFIYNENKVSEEFINEFIKTE